MLLFSLLVLVLELASAVKAATNQTTNQSSLKKEEEFVIKLGSLHTIYHRGKNERCDRDRLYGSSVQWLDMTLFTLDRINSNVTMLPGVRLVLEPFDDCLVDTRALQTIVRHVLNLVPEDHPNSRNNTFWGVIGPETSAVSTPTAKLLGLFHMPQISFAATSPVLSDKQRFPYFFRTIPSDKHQLMRLLTRAGHIDVIFDTRLLQENGRSTRVALSGELSESFIANVRVKLGSVLAPGIFNIFTVHPCFPIAAMIQVLEQNRWEFVSFIYEDDDYGTHAFDEFKRQTESNPSISVCLAVAVKLPRTTGEEAIAEVVRKLAEEERARVVIVFVTEYNLALILKKVVDLDLTEKFQWIGSDTWNGIQVNDITGFLKNESYAQALGLAMNGALSLTVHSLPDNNFEEYIRSRTPENTKNPYFAEYLSHLHKCQLKTSTNGASSTAAPPCPPHLTLPDDQGLVLMLETAADAVLAYAHALYNAQKTLCAESSVTVCDEFSRLSGKDLRAYLQNVTFTDPRGNLFAFDEHQDGPALYDIWRFEGIEDMAWKRTGSYADGAVKFSNGGASGRGNVVSTCGKECAKDEYQLFREVQTCCWVCLKCSENSVVVKNSTDSGCLSCGEEHFVDFENQTCIPVPVSYLSYEKSWAWPVTAAALFGLVLTLLTAITYIFSWDTALTRASGRELSSIILSGLTFGFASSFFFCFRPTVGLCGMRRVAAGLSFTLVYSALLVKTVRISLIFNTLGKRLDRDFKRLLRPAPQIVITLLLTSVELFLLGIWIVLQPPRVTKTRSTATGSEDLPVDFLDCEGLRSHALLIGLSFPIFLLLVCSVYAFRIRKVPQGFNEAKHIGFAVYTTLVIWLAQVSTYVANASTNIVLRDAIYCLGLSLNGLVILFAMFGPKVYIVIFRSEKNNQRMVMGPQSSRVRSPNSQSNSQPASPGPANRARPSCAETTISMQQTFTQLKLPTMNGDHKFPRKKIKDKRTGEGKGENGHVGDSDGGNRLALAQPYAIDVSDFNANFENCDDDVSAPATVACDTASVTSRGSENWERNVLDSFEKIKKNINSASKIVHAVDEPAKSDNSKKINGKASEGRHFHDGISDAANEVCTERGYCNPAFQADRLLCRVQSLPSTTNDFHSRDVLRQSNGSLRTPKIRRIFS